MTKKLRALLVIVPAGILIYLVSWASVSVAEVGSAAGEGRSTDVTVSIEACVVRVETEALEQSAGEAGFLALSSVEASRLLEHVGDGRAEVVSGIKVLVESGALAELTTEQDARQKTKAGEEDLTQEGESAISFEAQALVGPAGTITVQFTFKQTLSESSSVQASEEEQEEDGLQVIELSSKVSLEAGRPRVVGARKIDDQAMFVILYADI